jgi:hypothetical protein
VRHRRNAFPPSITPAHTRRSLWSTCRGGRRYDLGGIGPHQDVVRPDGQPARPYEIGQAYRLLDAVPLSPLESNRSC